MKRKIYLLLFLILVSLFIPGCIFAKATIDNNIPEQKQTEEITEQQEEIIEEEYTGLKYGLLQVGANFYTLYFWLYEGDNLLFEGYDYREMYKLIEETGDYKVCIPSSEYGVFALPDFPKCNSLVIEGEFIEHDFWRDYYLPDIPELKLWNFQPRCNLTFKNIKVDFSNDEVIDLQGNTIIVDGAGVDIGCLGFINCNLISTCSHANICCKTLKLDTVKEEVYSIHFEPIVGKQDDAELEINNMNAANRSYYKFGHNYKKILIHNYNLYQTSNECIYTLYFNYLNCEDFVIENISFFRNETYPISYSGIYLTYSLNGEPTYLKVLNDTTDFEISLSYNNAGTFYYDIKEEYIIRNEYGDGSVKRGIKLFEWNNLTKDRMRQVDILREVISKDDYEIIDDCFVLIDEE